MINPDLYPLCAACVTFVLFILLMLIQLWRSRRNQKAPGEWPDDIEYR